MRYNSFQPSRESINNLKLDLSNPRIGHRKDQSECVEAILNSKNFINLVTDIAINGLGISPIVVYQDDNNRLTVMDGNRRATALKLLENPSLAKQHSLFTRIQSLAKQSINNGLTFDSISVYKSTDIDSIYDHMKLTHTGENDGVGQKGWTAMAQALFAIDQNIPDENLLAAKLILFAHENSHFVFNDDYPVTVLTRLINKERLLKIGITYENGKISWASKSDAREKMLLTILSEIRDQDIKTKDIFNPDQQEKYLNQLFETYGVTPNTNPINVTDTPAKNTTDSNVKQSNDKKDNTSNTTPSPRESSPSKPTWDRKTVVHSNLHRFDFEGHSNKLNNIYVELKKVQLDGTKGTPIAAAFLIRAFSEMAIDEYRKKYSTGGESLSKKAINVMEHMFNNEKIESDLKRRITQLSNDDNFLSFSSLQKYLHSKNFHPSKQSVNTLWDELYPFLQACLKG